METLQMLETLNVFIEEERAECLKSEGIREYHKYVKLCRIFYKKEGDEK